MNREEKNLVIFDLKNLIESSEIFIIFHYRGLKDADFQNLRKTLRDHGSDTCVRVAKNSLLKRAVKDTEYKDVAQIATGPNAIAFSNDPSALAKAIVSFSKEHDIIVIRGGFLGKEAIDNNVIVDLSKLGTLEELRARLISVITSVQSKFINSLNYNSSNLVRLIGSYVKSKE